MKEKYIVFDTETPNFKNDRICSIGISVVEDGKVIKNLYYPVNPEEKFSAFNISIHGITPDMVENERTFPELWEEIEPIMRSGVPVAHNAQFDMSVLAKCLRFYGIEWKPVVKYICTCRMARACFPGMPNYRLNTLCDELEIELDHHNAASDCQACAEILRRCLEKGASAENFIRLYDMKNICTVKEPCAGKIGTV
jgi:DNA polymerase-3 subunit epsilon